MSASSFAAVSRASRWPLLVLMALAIALPASAHVPRSSQLDAIDATHKLAAAPPTADESIEFEPIKQLDAPTSFAVFTSAENRASRPCCASSSDPALQHLMHARYYSPTLGRFLSVDPGGFDPRRPQTWNRYSYVTNNPIGKVDPDGRAELEFTLTTSIPMRVVAAPSLTGTRYFHGDYGSTSFRTQQTFRVETDPARARGGSPLLSQRNVAGRTIEYDRSGKVIGAATATKVGSVSASFVNGQPVVNVSTSSANPLLSGAPTIDNSLTITGPASGKTVSVTGTLDGFPSATLSMTNANGQTSTIFSFDPRTVGNGPMSLLPKVGDQKVDVNCTDTGKCNGGVRP